MLGERGYSEENKSKEKRGGNRATKSEDQNWNTDNLDYGPSKLTKFNWGNSWLNGEEYYQILTHIDQYSAAYHFMKYPPKTHPSSTYTSPTSKKKMKMW